MNNDAFYLYHNWCQDLLNDYESAEDENEDDDQRELEDIYSEEEEEMYRGYIAHCL